MDGLIVSLAIDMLILILLMKSLQGFLQKFWNYIREGIRSFMMNLKMISEKSRSDTEEVYESQMSFVDDEYKNSKDNLSLFVASIQKFVGMNDVGISIGFKDISFTLGNGKTIVAPQTGHIEKGSVWAVMGASGAGKSEFS